MIPDRPQGIGLVESFACAAAGIRETAKGRNFRIQSCFAVLAIALSTVFRVSVVELIVVLACIALVLGGECMNTALESVVDLASPRYHELAKTAKDAAAGAVLCFSIGSFAVGFVLFAPRILHAIGIM